TKLIKQIPNEFIPKIKYVCKKIIFMESIIEEQEEQPKIHPRNAFIAFLLSVFTPGLGQIYNGQVKKGVVFFVLVLLVPVIFGLFNLMSFFYGFISIFIIEFIIRIYI